MYFLFRVNLLNDLDDQAQVDQVHSMGYTLSCRKQEYMHSNIIQCIPAAI
jgi:hypothetical protein